MTPRHPIPLSRIAHRLTRVSLQNRPDTPISGITHDSRTVRTGDLFVCLSGASHDGHTYVPAALERGASAILVNEGGLEALGVAVPSSVGLLAVPDTREALAPAACALYDDPSHKMRMVGVTGTNGKTTTTRMIAAILRANGIRTGVIGTLGADLDGAPMESEHTTPEADQLQALLAQMHAEGAGAVVMEVSSHALAQRRTDGVAFSAAVFTNLTQDHLDFHQSMEEYFHAKARLFVDYPTLYPRPDGSPLQAIINVTAPEGRRLAAMARGDVCTLSLAQGPATMTAENVELQPESARFEAVSVHEQDTFRLSISLPIGGAFQVGNALAAIAAARRLGVPLETIRAGLEQMPAVPGRFESVATGDLGFSVVVDYAHSPDGLENLLRSAQDLHPKRILVVFGCGGNRDRGKRPKMGRLAATMADVAVVTSDNPRHEEPNAIIGEILTGMGPNGETRADVRVEPDRRAAIGLALDAAKPGDIVLIAGKGHEDYQIVGDQVLAFDDRQVAREWLARSGRS